jgi:hypothetical protein
MARKYPRKEWREHWLPCRQDYQVDKLTIQAIYHSVRAFGEDAWNDNARLKAEGQRRVLKQFPPTAQINWAEWKLRSGVFSEEN